MSCGAGERLRPYWCSADLGLAVAKSFCNPKQLPIHREPCYPAHCAAWYADEWGQVRSTLRPTLQGPYPTKIYPAASLPTFLYFLCIRLLRLFFSSASFLLLQSSRRQKCRARSISPPRMARVYHEDDMVLHGDCSALLIDCLIAWHVS